MGSNSLYVCRLEFIKEKIQYKQLKTLQKYISGFTLLSNETNFFHLL
jgi:hypothetical protein